jgi:hypothetical protein
VLTRSIDLDLSGPTFEERLFRNGKRICVVVAVAAITVSALDLMNASALTTASALIHEGRLNYTELPGRVLSGIHQISIYRDRTSVVVAIPRDAPFDAQNLASISRPPATLYEPQRTAPVAVADKPVKNSAAVAELSAARHTDAVELAMAQPAVSVKPGAFALASLPADQMPAVQAVPEAVSRPVLLASLTTTALPVSTAVPEPIQISLPSLDKVPMPIPAPGVPPPSPAQRLKLEGKDYAKAERCLANAVYWESRSEPVRGQMAVAQVVMNRVFSGFYPNDVCGVVYQNASRHLSCQFTFACDGKRKTITERGHWARANRIAKQTLDGQIYVPEVAKSTHYHAAYVHPNWVREMRKMVRFGLHSFYRPYAWGNGAEEPVWGKTALAKTALAKTAMAKVETKKK